MNDMNEIIAAARSATVGRPVVLEARPLQTATEIATQPAPTPPANPSDYTTQIARESEREFTRDEVLGGQTQRRYPQEAFGASFHYTPKSSRKLLDAMGWKPAGKVAEAVAAITPLVIEFDDLIPQFGRWSPTRANIDYHDHINSQISESANGVKIVDTLDEHSRVHWQENYLAKRKQITARLEAITRLAIPHARTILLDARAAFLEFAKAEESRLRAEAAEWGYSLVMSHQWRVAIVGVLGLPGNRLNVVGYSSPRLMLEGIIDL